MRAWRASKTTATLSPSTLPGPVRADLERRRLVDPDADALRVLEDQRKAVGCCGGASRSAGPRSRPGSRSKPSTVTTLSRAIVMKASGESFAGGRSPPGCFSSPVSIGVDITAAPAEVPPTTAPASKRSRMARSRRAFRESAAVSLRLISAAEPDSGDAVETIRRVGRVGLLVCQDDPLGASRRSLRKSSVISMPASGSSDAIGKHDDARLASRRRARRIAPGRGRGSGRRRR